MHFDLPSSAFPTPGYNVLPSPLEQEKVSKQNLLTFLALCPLFSQQLLADQLSGGYDILAADGIMTVEGHFAVAAAKPAADMLQPGDFVVIFLPDGFGLLAPACRPALPFPE